MSKVKKMKYLYYVAHFPRGETEAEGNYTVGFRACPFHSDLSRVHRDKVTELTLGLRAPDTSNV